MNEKESSMVKRETKLPARIDAQALLASAVDKGAAVETLEKLMNLAERAQAWSARQAYNDALSAFQVRCPQIKKTAVAAIGDKFSFSYAPLEDIMPQIRPLMGDLGLSASWRQSKPSGPNMVAVVCRITHRDGHYEESPYPTEIPFRTDGRLSGGQVVSAANSFARRLSLCFMLGIVPEGEDIDVENEETRLAAAAAERRRSLEREEPEPGPPKKEPTFSDLEQAAIYRQLNERWRSLNLTRAQVIAILKGHSLSPGLVNIDADWTKVDVAVMKDMLKEAS